MGRPGKGAYTLLGERERGRGWGGERERVSCLWTPCLWLQPAWGLPFRRPTHRLQTGVPYPPDTSSCVVPFLAINQSQSLSPSVFSCPHPLRTHLLPALGFQPSLDEYNYSVAVAKSIILLAIFPKPLGTYFWFRPSYTLSCSAGLWEAQDIRREKSPALRLHH